MTKAVLPPSPAVETISRRRGIDSETSLQEGKVSRNFDGVISLKRLSGVFVFRRRAHHASCPCLPRNATWGRDFSFVVMSSFLLAVLQRYCIDFAGDDSFVAREAFVLRSSHIRYCRVIVSPATGRLTGPARYENA